MELKVKKLHEDAIIPSYGSKGAACFDLHALSVNGIYSGSSCLDEGFPIICRTGLSFDIPEGHVMMVYSRSGHGFKNSSRLSNCVGVIDSDYTGEVMVKLIKDENKADRLMIEPGDRIAQAMLVPVSQVTFTEVEELKKTERGAKGFGSTGK